MKWLTDLFKRCEHHWVLYQAYEVSSNITGRPTEYIHLLRCTKCGDMKSVRVGV